MKQIIGLSLLVVWFMTFIIGIAEQISDYETNTPTWVGWVYVIALLGLPFIALNLIMGDVNKKRG